MRSQVRSLSRPPTFPPQFPFLACFGLCAASGVWTPVGSNNRLLTFAAALSFSESSCTFIADWGACRKLSLQPCERAAHNKNVEQYRNQGRGDQRAEHILRHHS